MQRFFERYLYAPTLFDRILSFVLLPLSGIYCLVVYSAFLRAKERDFGIPIVGVGNLSVGGSGKTPLVTELAGRYAHAAIVLRGYGRKSRGLHVVSDAKKVLCDVATSGDEAMIYAKKLPDCVVIVSEDRDIAIERAKAMGCRVVFLDDGYSKLHIKKLDILIDVDTPNRFCLPSGAYRAKEFGKKRALHVKEGVDFTREVFFVNATEKMSLVSAIAKPNRLLRYIDERVIAHHFFDDHYYFSKEELERILREDKSDSLLVTYKDLVKIESFHLPTSLMDMRLRLSDTLVKRVDSYIKEYYNT